VVRLTREDLFRADVAALERLVQWLGIPEPKCYKTEPERKALLVLSIERYEKRIGGKQGPRRRMY
jgi:hypothetical protein